MMITDTKGNYIEITNLTDAIRQASEFMHYSHTDPAFSEFDQQQRAYWTDIYNQLAANHTTKF